MEHGCRCRQESDQSRRIQPDAIGSSLQIVILLMNIESIGLSTDLKERSIALRFEFVSSEVDFQSSQVPI